LCCRKFSQEKLYKAFCALDDVFTLYVVNKELWRDTLNDAIHESAGRRILACNFRTPNLQVWWGYIYADIIEHYKEYNTAAKPTVCLMSCIAITEPMHVLQSLLTAVGVSEAHSKCSIEQCLAELETSLVHCSSSSSSGKVILVLHQIHRLAELGDAGTIVLERLFQLTQSDSSRLILVGLTSQAALPLSIQQLTQEKNYVKLVKLTDIPGAQTEAQTEEVVQAAVGGILLPTTSRIVRQWIALAGSWIPVAVDFCHDVIEIAWNEQAGSVINEQHLIAAYREHLDLEANRQYLSCFKHNQLACMIPLTVEQQ
jgi:hypothetical protein